ncbi:MAG: hypothetical protein M0P13_11400 [Fibrobacteraceae bacterium]|nr:hypothetical protein [Fibrobacteraceae bacterium]
MGILALPLAIGIGFFALLICIFWPKIPGFLVAIIARIAFVKIFGFDESYGVATIGARNHIPSRFPVPAFPDIGFGMMPKMVQLALLGAIESSFRSNRRRHQWSRIFFINSCQRNLAS